MRIQLLKEFRLDPEECNLQLVLAQDGPNHDVSVGIGWEVLEELCVGVVGELHIHVVMSVFKYLYI